MGRMLIRWFREPMIGVRMVLELGNFSYDYGFVCLMAQIDNCVGDRLSRPELVEPCMQRSLS